MARILNPRQALNKAYLKLKPLRAEIELFKGELRKVLERSNDTESEEFHKNLISDFLKHCWYGGRHFINTKGRKDLVIHNGRDSKSPVGVILEVKKPTNRAEMVRTDGLNCKAMQELLLYYFRERIGLKNLELRHLVVTNIYEWFVFDAQVFERVFARDKKLVKQFTEFEAGRLSGTTTDFFYREIASPALEAKHEELEFAHFDIRNYQKPLSSESAADDRKLVALYKLLSPEHLLKKPFANDSNSLNEDFYLELLHIIGLEQTGKSKKLIQRKPPEKRDPGSLLENAIEQLELSDRLRRLRNLRQYGTNREEQLFNVALELVITWMNRVLFLKLLEAQLLNYHKGDEAYAFLRSERIRNFDDLQSLFFAVLAKKPGERSAAVREEFARVPYLNSSLFEYTELEDRSLFISGLRDDRSIELHPKTALKTYDGKRRSGRINALEYLFSFLNHYDFSSEGGEDIQEDNKTLINASVLGLIFEKINGYKDGSFFTPGFITMYMCRETIRRAVLQKFREEKNWDCKNLDELYDRIEDRAEANRIVNQLKICDPAVGSGHFLVSALNEMIAVKNDLRILEDREGRRLKEYHFEVVNDELLVTDEDGALFEYRPGNRESQRVQEALFHEKRAIIEHCLFGVDINPNSVKICRLRLWIELLKNAYYNADGSLETLPNIDINIKCGNSLISRFELDTDLSKALRKSGFSIEVYRAAVSGYQQATTWEEKRGLTDTIDKIKDSFRSEIALNDPLMKKASKLRGEIYKVANQSLLFDETEEEKAERRAKEQKLAGQLEKVEAQIEEIQNNKIYDNAFEWRFEFPEVLDDNGDFRGFDVVIGNPPYGRYLKVSKDLKRHLKKRNIYGRTGDMAEYFIKMVSKNLLRKEFCFSFIVPKGLSYVSSWQKTRELMTKKIFINEAIDTSRSFSEAAYEMMIFVSTNVKPDLIKTGRLTDASIEVTYVPFEIYQKGIFFFGFPDGSYSIAEKILKNSINITRFYNLWYGKGGMTPKTNQRKLGIPVLRGKEVQKFYIKEIVDKWYVEAKHLSKDDMSKAECEKVVAQDIVAHIKRPKPHIKLTSTIDYKSQLCLNTIMCFETKGQLSHSFLVGLINSKLLSFYYYYFIFNQAIRTMHFMPGYADKFPIPTEIPNPEAIEQRVERIMEIKSQDPSADTSGLEGEIDGLVYELYGLTEEEIGVIENNQ